MKITIQQLCLCMPHCPYSRALMMLDHLNAAMERAVINTPLRAAAFIATVGHESLDLLYMKEIADGSKYEGRRDLGNIQPGDGKRFKGRGPIQVTGRSNYTDFGKWASVPCVTEPELLEAPSIGFLASAWFWMSRGLNALADEGDFLKVSTKVNGKGKDGLPNHWKERETRYNLAKKVLT